MNKPTELKIQIHQACLDKVKERIQNLENRLQTITDSKESEMKSSVGDKFETGRTMLQIDGEKVREQLNLNQSVKVQLQQVILDKKSAQVRNGSLVETDKGLYFIAIGLGKMTVNGQVCFCVSTDAPVGKALIGAKVGDEIKTEQAKLTILEIH